MPYPFVIRILNKRLRKEKFIGTSGADRFAKGRIIELTKAIEALTVSESDTQGNEAKKTKRGVAQPSPTDVKQLNLFQNEKSICKRGL